MNYSTLLQLVGKMKTLKLLFYPILGIILVSCFENDKVVMETTATDALFLEGLFIQLDSPGTECDWILDASSEIYGFDEPIEDFFLTKSILFDTQNVVVRYDTIVHNENCANFDQWIQNLEVFEQKPLTDDTGLLNQSVQFTAHIDSIYVMNDYLIVDYSASGCDRFTWDVALVNTGANLVVSPPERNLVFWFSNRGGCALETRQKAIFNIQELRIAGGQVLLNISNNSDQNRSVIYSY